MSDNPLTVEQEGKDWLLGCLRNPKEKVSVTFTKKDGTERVLNCTLAESRIPADKAPKEGAAAKKSDEAQAVFDTDIGEWRSFRWDSVKEIKVDAA